MPPTRTVTSPQDGQGLSAIHKFGEAAVDSPVSEYSTPKGSPTGRNSPLRSAYSSRPIPPRSPQPLRPPRPNEAMPIQAAQARNHFSSGTAPKSKENLGQYGDKASKLSPKSRIGQNSQSGASAQDSIDASSMPLDFDLPPSQHTTRPSTPPRKTQLVPPSSSRKGGSSLYSQGTPFSPILEESPDAGSKKRASFASSRAVPSSWGSHPDDYNFDRIQEKIEDEEEIRNSHSPASPGSTGSMHDDTTGLVRQASWGKKMKPSLTRIRNSSENVAGKKKETVGLATITAGVAAGALGPSLEKFPVPASRHSPSNESMGNRTILLDSSTSNSGSSSPGSGKDSTTLVEPIGRSRSPLASASDRSARQPASPLFVTNRPSSKGPSMSDKVPSNRRPPLLDMGAVRDSETRASITSLPDLIRRATRLAANLDRGKTASRTGMLDMDNSEKEQRRRSGSISDILAAFPPPSRGTPDGTRSASRWPSPFPSKLNQRMSCLTSKESGSTHLPQKGRRCCGMSMAAFIIIMLLLAILIAAAVVVPVVLIVLPRQRQAEANANGSSNLSNCPDSTPCQNGGMSVVSGNSCRCICANGFTGDRCGVAADSGCISTDLQTGTEQFTNVTLGTALPRLLSGASTNYSIPLNSSAILSLFSANNLSCTSENALVTFEGPSIEARAVAQKPAGNDPLPSTHSALSLQPTSTPQVGSSRRLEQRQVGTSNGIVFQMTSTAAAIPTSLSPTSSGTSTSTTSSSASSSPPASETQSPETVDFARIAVLYVFEQSGQLNSAIQAQASIQDFLLGLTNTNETVSLESEGLDLSLNFANFSITLANGIELGGRGDGNGGVRAMERKRSMPLWSASA